MLHAQFLRLMNHCNSSISIRFHQSTSHLSDQVPLKKPKKSSLAKKPRTRPTGWLCFNPSQSHRILRFSKSAANQQKMFIFGELLGIVHQTQRFINRLPDPSKGGCWSNLTNDGHNQWNSWSNLQLAAQNESSMIQLWLDLGLEATHTHTQVGGHRFILKISIQNDTT